MLNKLLSFIREHAMLAPGDRLYVAVSGGADSMALLWGMYLVKDQLGIELHAAHFDHNLRGEASHADRCFVEGFCRGYNIPLEVGEGTVVAGKKGLEAAARDARYDFLSTLPGKVATAHTADDNAETLIMHLMRGTGLKGLGGISPRRDNLIRPMLNITRTEVEAFLQEYAISHREDGSNHTDQFLRNRIRHHVMPLLLQENPSICQNLSRTALYLRQDGQTLDALAAEQCTAEVSRLRDISPAVLNRVCGMLLKDWGVREPEAEHIRLLQSLVFSENPSARAHFPGGITVSRVYDRLEKQEMLLPLQDHILNCPGATYIPELDITVCCTREEIPDAIAIRVSGPLHLRSRQEGDTIRLSGGSKRLKKLYIDRKIPQSQRSRIPVLADDMGVAAVYGIGVDADHKNAPTVYIRWEKR